MARPRGDTASILAPPPLLFGGCLLLGRLVDRLLPLAPLPLGDRAPSLLGGGLVLLSVAVGLSALLALHRHQTPAEPWKETVCIVSSGPYRFSRNPIYLCLLLLGAGLAFGRSSVGMTISVPVLFLLLDRGVVRGEERYLARRFSDEYSAYQRGVRRWI